MVSKARDEDCRYGDASMQSVTNSGEAKNNVVIGVECFPWHHIREERIKMISIFSRKRHYVEDCGKVVHFSGKGASNGDVLSHLHILFSVGK